MHPSKFIKLYLICLACFGIWVYAYPQVDLSIALNAIPINIMNKKPHSKEVNTNFKAVKNSKVLNILLWPNAQFPFNKVLHEKSAFYQTDCPVKNCFITSLNATKGTSPNVIKKEYIFKSFDVIAHMGENLSNLSIPSYIKSYYYGIHVYFNMNSSPNCEVQDKTFDNYFHRTATYRLDSDIPVPHLLVRDTDGNQIGPKINMVWTPEEEVNDNITAGIIRGKYRAAAIIDSKCDTLSSRGELIAELHKELHKFGYKVDVYGKCGQRKCSHDCNERLGMNYYFYLSYEDSLDKDYVTDQLLIPLQNNMVPIVYGGANYNMFLPPGSYLDASKMTANQLSKTMARLIASPKKYLQFFWWKKYYTYHDPTLNENICNFCAYLHRNDVKELSETYKSFRKWWNIYGYD
nr:alpha-(1,3)-fucosyltransferase C-like isoform X2 [Plodia interpunctella]